MESDLHLSLRQYFESSSWPSDSAALETTLAWLGSHRVKMVLDLAELGAVSRLSGALQRKPETLAFVQSRVDVRALFSCAGGEALSGHMCFTGSY